MPQTRASSLIPWVKRSCERTLSSLRQARHIGANSGKEKICFITCLMLHL